MGTPELWIDTAMGSCRETIKALDGARKLGYHVGWGNPGTTDGKTPVGSVDFCESWLGYHPVPYFYPEFLHSWMHRHYELEEHGERFSCLMPAGMFVKSAERYKAFPATIARLGTPFPSGRLWLSSVVHFTQEWRYYVADGCVLATGWYDGDNEDEPAPELVIDWPTGFCGAVDFGRLSDGRIALVENHHPYACGWYGDDSCAFVEWLIAGWHWTLKQGELDVQEMAPDSSGVRRGVDVAEILHDPLH